MTGNIKLALGQVLERYTVEGKLGAGGVARVYLVRHNTLGSLHALKVLRVHDDAMHERLVQEGQVQAQLRHENIVAVTDVVDVDGSPGLVMDYVDGPSLHHWLRENRPDLEQAEAIFRGILAGVARAHRIGLVHRDLKPANVLLAFDEHGRPIPKVADFGLAKILTEGTDDSGHNTRSGTTMGTPAYMAPEQVRDAKSVDQRADIFALGCILYELVTGVSPFYHQDLFAIFSALASGSYDPPESLAPDLPTRIRMAIAGCLSIRREDRINSCTLLQDVLDGAPITMVVDSASMPPSLGETPAPRPVLEASIGPTALGSPTGASTTLRMAGWLSVAGLGVAAIGMFGAILVVLGLIGWYHHDRETVADPVRTPTQTQTAPASVPAPAPVVPPDPVEAVEAPIATPTPTHPTAGPVAAPHAPARPTTGTVTAGGDADKVWLEGPAGRVDLGSVAPGEYRIQAEFKGQAPVAAGRVTVRVGESVALSCSSAFQMCQAK